MIQVIGCDDELRYWDVTINVPITIRLAALTDAAAEQKALRYCISEDAKALIPIAAGEMLSIGFPMWEATKAVSEP